LSNDTESQAPKLVVRVKLGGGGILGPGKADLLETIERVGSISAAARQMRMSYRQAWLLLNTMNEAFRQPVVQTSQGGPRGGGATLTDLGRQLLGCYRSLQEKARKSTSAELATIADLMTSRRQPTPRRRHSSSPNRRRQSST
jgi:molybdate transport system regulatory protein